MHWRREPIKTSDEAVVKCCFYVPFLSFSSILCAREITRFKDSEIKNSILGKGRGGRGGQALITLKINPSNGHDYADT